MTTLSNLITAETQDQILAALLAELQVAGLPVTDWSATSPDRSYLEIFAQALAERNALAPQVAGGVLLEHSACAGAWLTLTAYEFYQLTRNPATRTVRRVRLTNASSSPYTIAVGSFWIAGSATGNRYVSSAVGAGVVAAGGGTLDIEVTSEFPNDSAAGLSYTDAEGTLTVLLTPRPGLTGVDYQPTFSDVVQTGSGAGIVTPSGTVVAASWIVEITVSGAPGAGSFRYRRNVGAWSASTPIPGPGIYGPDGFGLVITFAGVFAAGDQYAFAAPGTSVITQGVDEETDAALKSRCRARWPSLSLSPTLAVYEQMALRASSEVTRCKAVTSTTINARVTVYLAGQAGPVTAAVVNQVVAYLVLHAPITARPTAASATPLVITLAGTITISAGYTAAALATAQSALSAYLNASVPLGGVVRYAQIFEELMAPDGVVDLVITLNGATANLTLAATEIPSWSQTLSTTLTIVEI